MIRSIQAGKAPTTLKQAAAALCSGLLVFALAACGSTGASGSGSAASGEQGQSSSQGSSNRAKGFEEFPIGHDVEVGPLNVAMVYFQPVDMKPSGMGLSAAEASFHLEADIHALADNKLGYSKGEFVPDLTVQYSIVSKDTGKTAASGTFMQMNAADGPHYGANVKLDQAGRYTLTLSIHSPAEKGWALHVDKETGVSGEFWTTPLKASFDWNYTPHKW